MSAFMCSDRHLTALAAYAVRHGLSGVVLSMGDQLNAASRGLDAALVDEVYRVLATTNRDSLDARYPNDPGEALGKVCTKTLTEQIPPLHIIKACHCYAYQSCEHTGWKGSRAESIVGRIESHAVHALPGYKDAPWGL